MKNIHQQLEGNQNRRMASQSRFLDKIDSREENAEKMLGQLVREGKIIYYAWPQGGRYCEGGRLELVAFLIRNNYA